MERLTYHAREVAPERIGLPERRAARFLENALDRARGAEAFTGRQRVFLEEKSRDVCQALAYNGYCLIHSSQGRCVTVYSLPTWFSRRQHYNGKERIRNMRKYMRFNRGMKGEGHGIHEV